MLTLKSPIVTSRSEILEQQYTKHRSHHDEHLRKRISMSTADMMQSFPRRVKVLTTVALQIEKFFRPAIYNQEQTS
jgi:hypothetical protein